MNCAAKKPSMSSPTNSEASTPSRHKQEFGESHCGRMEWPLLHASQLHRSLFHTPRSSFHTIVRRFLRDDDVVHVALAQSRRRYANESALFPEFL